MRFFLRRIALNFRLRLDRLGVLRCSVPSSRIRSSFWIVLASVWTAYGWLSADTIVALVCCICLWRVVSNLATWTIHSVSNWSWWTAGRCESWLNFSLGCTIWRRSVWAETLVETFALSRCVLAVATLRLCRSSCGWLSLTCAIRTNIVATIAGRCIRQAIWSFRLRLALRLANYCEPF